MPTSDTPTAAHDPRSTRLLRRIQARSRAFRTDRPVVYGRVWACALLAAVPFFAPAPARSAPPTATLAIRETAGLRRFGYPVAAEVGFRHGVCAAGQAFELLDGRGRQLPGQFDALDTWPDGSVRTLGVSFNWSGGPLEADRLTLRPADRAPAAGRRVLAETADAFEALGYRIPKRGPVLIGSIRYDREFLRPGAGVRLEARGAAGPLEEIPGRRAWRVLKPGPLNVTLQLHSAYRPPAAPTSAIPDPASRIPSPVPLTYHASRITLSPSRISHPASRIAPAEIPFTTTLEFPDSKSWFRVTHLIDAPEGEVRSVVLSAGYAFEMAPALFDFGCGSWVYCHLAAKEEARLALAGPAAGPAWQILTGESGQAGRPYAAASPSQPRSEGWGHLIDGGPNGRAVAFGSPEFRDGLRGEIALAATGAIRLEWELPRGGGAHPVTAYFHHVANPIQISAVTSPASMLNPPGVGRAGAQTE